MLRATLYVKVKTGMEGEFEREWRAVAERVRHEPGNVRQTLLRDPEDRCSFIIASDWESREAFTRFEKSSEQDALTSVLRDLRESARMTVHDVVTHVEST